MKQNKKRWANYRKANDDSPEVRENELKYMLKKINPKNGEIILECGTGNGYLTFPIAKKIGKFGKVITYDVILKNLKAVEEKNKKEKLKVITKNQKENHKFQEKNNSIDKIISIATFHHYDNLLNHTGFSGRKKALKEFYRILKKKGKLIIGDVGEGMVSAKYFQTINSPKYCAPEGHPHDFPTKDELKSILMGAGFKLKSYVRKKVPWTFKSENQAKIFLKTIHNALCTGEESLEHAKKSLRFRRKGNKYYLDWELFYLIAEKR